MNNTISSVKVVSTGSPQGCVLSPFYSFYTQMTAGASVRIGILLNSQMIQLSLVCCLTIKLAMVLC